MRALEKNRNSATCVYAQQLTNAAKQNQMIELIDFEISTLLRPNQFEAFAYALENLGFIFRFRLPYNVVVVISMVYYSERD